MKKENSCIKTCVCLCTSPRARMFEQRPCGDALLFIAFDVIEINYHQEGGSVSIAFPYSPTTDSSLPV